MKKEETSNAINVASIFCKIEVWSFLKLPKWNLAKINFREIDFFGLDFLNGAGLHYVIICLFWLLKYDHSTHTLLFVVIALFF